MYLKLFGNPDGASIGVFNIAAERFIPVASIRDEASKAWFYDCDGQVERTFGPIESRAAHLLDQILRHDRLPRRFSSTHHSLLTFVSLQHERTQAALAEVNERTDRYVKALLRHQFAGQVIVENLHLVKISRPDAIAESLLAARLGMPLLYDLKYKLIENVSGCAFFMSDAPVLFHNRLFAGTGAPAHGYAKFGLQILVPIRPWRAILFYDDVAYHVGSLASSTIRLVNPAVAMRINDLQWESGRQESLRLAGDPCRRAAGDAENRTLVQGDDDSAWSSDLCIERTPKAKGAVGGWCPRLGLGCDYLGELRKNWAVLVEALLTRK